MSMVEQAPAKINLTLDILGRRPDGLSRAADGDAGCFPL